MNRNVLYVAIGVLAVAAVVFGYQPIRSGKRRMASK